MIYTFLMNYLISPDFPCFFLNGEDIKVRRKKNNA